MYSKRVKPSIELPGALALAIALTLSTYTRAQFVFDSGSSGIDGPLSPQQNVVIDLNSKPDGIFNYTDITIPAGVTVSFINNLANTPVIWLASGAVQIDGVVDINGENGHHETGPFLMSKPGPGGFPGGTAEINDSSFLGGFGPGGGGRDATLAGAGSFGSAGQDTIPGAQYGNIFLFPLIGGSGGAGGFPPAPSLNGGGGGGAGGGAILVASSISITVNGSILARGGDNLRSFSNSAAGKGGSGGAIRLIANAIYGQGALDTLGGLNANGNRGRAGQGRVRIEAFQLPSELVIIGPTTMSSPGPIFPPSNAPTITATMVGAQVLIDPKGNILGQPDAEIASIDPVQIQIEAQFVPVGTTITVRVAPTTDVPFEVTSTPLAGTFEQSVATADITFPPGDNEVTLRTEFAPGGGSGADLGPNRKSDSKHARRDDIGTSPSSGTFSRLGGWLDRSIAALTAHRGAMNSPADPSAQNQPMMINGEPIERVEVLSAGDAVGTQVVYVARSGIRHHIPSPR